MKSGPIFWLLPVFLAIASPLLFSGEGTWARIYHRSMEAGQGYLSGKSIARTRSNDFFVTGSIDSSRFSLLKINPSGDVLWTKEFFRQDPLGSSLDTNRPIITATGDEGCAVGWGPYLIKIDRNGGVKWFKRCDFRAADDPNPYGFTFTFIRELEGGGYIITGEKGFTRVFAARLTRDGAVIWKNWYPGVPHEYAKILPIDRPGALDPEEKENFILGCTSLGPGSPDVYLGAKIYRLSASGRVKWCRVYYDDAALRTPPSSYGGIQSLCLTPSGDIVVSKDRWDTGWGATFFKLSSEGEIRWTNWVGGRLSSGINNVITHAAEAVPDGGFVFAGETSEFTDHTTSGRDYWLLMKLGGGGDIQWIRTVGGFTADNDVAESCVGLDDGGLIAAGIESSISKSKISGLLLVRMGIDGSVSKLGDFMTAVDLSLANIRNPRLRIQTPPLYVRGGSGKSGNLIGDVTDVAIGEENGSSAGEDVEGFIAEKLIFEPLYPYSPAIETKVMRGGTAYRYFVLKAESGQPAEGAEIRYYTPLSGSTNLVKSGKDGEVAFKIPVGGTKECKIYNEGFVVEKIKIGGREYPFVRPDPFSIEVVPLTYSTNWSAGNGSAGKVGLGVLVAGAFAEGSQKGGMVISRTKADPDKSDSDSLAFNNNSTTESALGLEAGFDFKGKLGPIKAKAVDASVKVQGSSFSEFTTLFNAPSHSSTTEKLMEALSLLTGATNCVSAGGTQLVDTAINAIIAALSSKVDVKEIIQGFGFAYNGDLSLVKLGLETKAGELSGLGLGNLTENVEGKYALSIYPVSGEMGAKFTLILEAGAGLAQLFGFDVGEAKLMKEISLEFVFGFPLPDFRRALLTLSQEPDSRGEVQGLVFSLTPENLEGAVVTALHLENYAALQSAIQNSDFILDRSVIAALVRTAVNIVSKIHIPYERVVFMDEEPTELDISLGIDIGGNQVELGISPKYGRYESFVTEQGLFVPIDNALHIGRLVSLATYGPGLYDSHVDALPSMITDILSVVGDILADVWNIVTGVLSNAAGTALDAGASLGGEVVGGAEVVFDKGTDFLGGILSDSRAISYDGPLYASVFPMQKKTSKKKVTVVSVVPSKNPFILGGLYSLQPLAGKLSKPAALTLRYSEKAAGIKDPKKFSVFRYAPEDNAWELLASEHDFSARKLKVRIDKLGEYAIGYDATPPRFALLNISEEDVVLGKGVRFVVGCRDEGSGIDGKSLASTVDGAEVQVRYNKLRGEAVIDAPEPFPGGSHTLVVTGKDTAGNEGSRSFAFSSVVPPSKPMLELKAAKVGSLELGISGVNKGTYPIKNLVLKRAKPETGKVFSLLETLNPGETEFKDQSVKPGIRYAYKITAVDERGFRGLDSSILYVTAQGKAVGEEEAQKERLGEKEKEGKGPGGKEAGKKTELEGEKKGKQGEKQAKAGFHLGSLIVLASLLILVLILFFVLRRR
jgi:hypothetical protein